MKLFLIILGLLLVLYLSFAIRRYPFIGVLAVGFFVATEWEFPAWPSLVSFLGVGLSFTDGVMAALLIVSIQQWAKQSTKLTWIHGISCGLILVFALSLVRGIVGSPSSLVASEGKPWIYLAVVVTWVATSLATGRLSRDSFEKAVILIGWMVTAAGAYHLVSFGLGSAGEFVTTSTGDIRTARILVSGQAVFLCCAAFVAIHRWTRVRRLVLLPSAFVFVSVAVLAQHRSVWAALAAGVVLYVVVGLTTTRTRGVSIITGVAALTALVVLALNLISFLPFNVTELIQDRNTYNDRTAGWESLVDQSIQSGIVTQLIGFPTGNGWDRYSAGGTLITYQPHNWYVTVYLRAGLIGLTLLVLVIALIFRKLVSRRSAEALAVLAVLSVYGWPYAINWYLGLFIGWLIYVATSERSTEYTPASMPWGREPTSDPETSYRSTYTKGRVETKQ